GLNLSPSFFKNSLKVELNLHGTITNTRFANQGAIGNAITFDPTQPVTVAGSKFGGYYEWLGANDSTLNNNSNRNPVAMLEQNDGRSEVQRSFGNIKLDYAIPYISGLHANLNLGYDIGKGNGNTFIPADAAQNYNNSIDSLRGYNTPYLQKYINETAEFYLGYNKDIASIKSNINAVAGYGYYDNLTKNYSYTQLSATDKIRSDIANNPPLYFYSPTEYTMISYYGRLIYTFNDKYILMGSLRTDGSSRFSPSNRWGTFPSAAFTWRMKQEDFLKNSTVLSQLNLRLSYGKTGNQDGIGLYGYIPTYFLSTPGSLYPFGNTFYNMYTPSAYIKNLTWETTATYDGGFDYGFLDNRINGSIDYYYKKTTNLLANVSIPSGSNFANKETTNIGSMTDQGIDFNVNLIPVKNKDWDWEIGFNASYNKFEITNLTLVPDPNFIGNATGGISGGTGNTVQIDAVGSAPNTFYLYQQIYDAKGNPIEGLYVDQNRDGIINQGDLVKNKSPYPAWTLGFNNSLAYQKWTLNFVMRANIGNYMYNNTASGLAVTRSILNPNSFLENAPSSVLKSSFSNNQYFSNYYLENASFLRMDNIGLSYNYGSLSKDQKYNLRISLNCQNVFVITKYTGSDPEIYGGIDNNFYSRPRTFTLGLNLSL
ncbi:MAG TPA: TonB-dependent receptor, partial [Hanamia sp.]|nr:TonB-dependent receptor [Hanamia sp.]